MDPYADWDYDDLDEGSELQILIDDLPHQFMADLESESGCFRTEIRDTGKHICGVHTNGEYWDEAQAMCPEVRRIGGQLSVTMWNLLSSGGATVGAQLLANSLQTKRYLATRRRLATLPSQRADRIL